MVLVTIGKVPNLKLASRNIQSMCFQLHFHTVYLNGAVIRVLEVPIPPSDIEFRSGSNEHTPAPSKLRFCMVLGRPGI